MMGFYMDEVLPAAMRTSSQHQHSVGDLGNLLLSLRAMMRRCVSGGWHCRGGQRGRAGLGGGMGWRNRDPGRFGTGFVLTSALG